LINLPITPQTIISSIYPEESIYFNSTIFLVCTNSPARIW